MFFFFSCLHLFFIDQYRHKSNVRTLWMIKSLVSYQTFYFVMFIVRKAAPSDIAAGADWTFQLLSIETFIFTFLKSYLIRYIFLFHIRLISNINIWLGQPYSCLLIYISLIGWMQRGCEERCAEDQFQCHNNLCISLKWLCDGQEDCKMGEDERNCQETGAHNTNYFLSLLFFGSSRLLTLVVFLNRGSVGP